MANKYDDIISYPSKPDSLVGLENYGEDGQGLKFSNKSKKGKDDSRMPTIDEAYSTGGPGGRGYVGRG